MLYILIPIHNNIHETLKCLNCIHTQTYTNYEVIIVNDGSTDNSNEIIQNEFSDITILQGDGDLWWAGALHAGIEYVLRNGNHNDNLLILNNDLIFDNDYLSNLIEALYYNHNAVIGSLCKDQKNNTLVDSGVCVDWEQLKFTQKQVDNSNDDLIHNIDVLSTRGLIVPYHIVKSVGNFIPHRIRHYLSDYEYTIRIKKHGFRLLTSKKSVVYLNKSTTGIHTKWTEHLTYNSIFKTIFSTKSSSNLKSWLFFIHLCCPANYKLSCYWKITGGKVFEIIGKKV